MESINPFVEPSQSPDLELQYATQSYSTIFTEYAILPPLRFSSMVDTFSTKAIMILVLQKIKIRDSLR